MKALSVSVCTSLALALGLLCASLFPAYAVNPTSAFTYQGLLLDGGAPANGSNDLRFVLFDAATNGLAIGANLTLEDVTVSNGLFTVTLDFGAAAFDGGDRWLEMRVRPGASVGLFTTLSPRQKINAAPYAVKAGNAETAVSATTAASAATADSASTATALTGPLGSSSLSGSYSNVVSLTNTGNTFNGTHAGSFSGSGAGLTNLNASQLTSGTVADARLSANVPLLSGATFLGNLAAPAVSAAGLLSGKTLKVGTNNLLSSSISSIAGGANNTNLAEFSFIGGGSDNTISSLYSGIASGTGQQIVGVGTRNFIGGGENNLMTNAADSVIAGGGNNLVESGSNYGAIGGGAVNTIKANSLGAAIPGGFGNVAAGNRSFAAGSSAHANHDGTFVWADYEPGALDSTGTNQFLIRASGGVGINTNNPASALHVVGTVTATSFTGSGAGLTSLPPAALAAGTVPSAVSFSNLANTFNGAFNGTQIGNGAGLTNLNASQLTTGIVPDGRLSANVPLLSGNATFAGNVTAGGFLRGLSLNVGLSNNTAGNASIAGGYIQTNLGAGSFIGNGTANYISLQGSVIGGGANNRIFGTIGSDNVIGGGNDNSLSDGSANVIGGGANHSIETNVFHSTIGGGFQNTIKANAKYAMIPGGYGNSAVGNYSFAAGLLANAKHTGAFVWGDSQLADFVSTGPNQFLIRASGGVGINTNNPASALHVNGTVTATSFAGSGAGLGGVNAAQLGGLTGAQFLRSDTAGTLAGALTINAGGGANSIFTASGIDRPSPNNVNFNLQNSDTGSLTLQVDGNTVWHAGNDGAGSGLDADLLDGLSSAKFLRADVSADGSNLTNLSGSMLTGDLTGQRLNIGTGHTLTGNLASIAGGAGNTNESFRGFIGGGRNNAIRTNSDYAFIGGGFANTIQTNSDKAVIGGGNLNLVEANSSAGVIAGGVGNVARSGSGYATISGGQLNVVTNDTPYATIPGGAQALTRSYGQMAYASGQFTQPGDAQSSLYVLRNNSVSTNLTELFLDGSGRRMNIPIDGAWGFNILLVGRANNGTTVSYELKGTVKNVAGTVTIVGAPTVTLVGGDTAGTTAAVEGDSVNDALVIKVTGLQSIPFRWVASVRTVETLF